MLKRNFIPTLLVLLANLASAASVLKPGDKLAICGDSITEQKLYSVYIADYLLMCRPVADVQVMQFGWSGEYSWGFLPRMEYDCLQFKPTIATTCFGMNDGGQGALIPERAERYRQATAAIADTFMKAGVRVVLGSPGCVDSDRFYRDPKRAAVYNQTLAAHRDIVRQIASEKGVPFADVFTPMANCMAKAKARYGADYHVAGPDGVHPAANGHLIMAYAFLKALECDGEIGTITIDVAARTAAASEGHVVKSFDGVVAVIQSSRYPFCFYDGPEAPGDPASVNSTRGVLEFLPFNQELNRFNMVAKGIAAPRARVTFGAAGKVFAAAQLAGGINLAAEFLDNPFSEPFRKVEQAILTQQRFETPMIKCMVHEVRAQLPDEHDILLRIVEKMSAKQQALARASSAAVVPVTYEIRIEPLEDD